MDTALTHEILLAAFARYNTLFTPWNWVIFSSAVLAALLACKQSDLTSRTTTYLLAVIWLWGGVSFLMVSLAPAYPLAIPLGLLSVTQGFAFILAARHDVFAFAWRTDPYGIFGLMLVLFGLVGYPLVGATYPQIAIAGVSCPSAIFTFGMLLITRKRVPLYLLIIPALWAVSSLVPISAGMREDSVLLVAGVLVTTMIVLRDRRRSDAESSAD